jgi:hypothetical protein
MGWIMECEECKHYEYCKLKGDDRDNCIGHHDEAFKRDDDMIFFAISWKEIQAKQQKLK